METDVPIAGLTVDEMLPILISIARKYEKTHLNRFQTDELVNEIWLNGKLHKQKDFKHLCMRIHWDIQDYIREERGLKSNCLGKNKVAEPIHYNHMSSDSDDKGDDWIDKFHNREDAGSSEVDKIDWFDGMLCGCNYREKVAMKLSFIYGYTHVMIAKIIGVSESRVSQIKEKVLQRMRRRFKTKGIKYEESMIALSGS